MAANPPNTEKVSIVFCKIPIVGSPKPAGPQLMANPLVTIPVLVHFNLIADAAMLSATIFAMAWLWGIPLGDIVSVGIRIPRGCQFKAGSKYLY